MSSQVSKFSKVVTFSKKYPVFRGIASYGVIWPVGCFIQQSLLSEKEVDLAKVGRFCLFGSCYVAPTLHLWIKIANKFWPHNNLRSALTKAFVEQFTYTPFAMVSFFFGMTLLEGKSIEDGVDEIKEKFLATYKIGWCVWPALQTFNYTVIKERNRVVFVSFCSLMWSSFLAYMKHLEKPVSESEGEHGSTEASTNPTSSVKSLQQISKEVASDKTWIVKPQLDR